MTNASSNVILQVALMHPKGARVKQVVKKLAYLSSNVTFASASDGAGDKARCAEVLGKGQYITVQYQIRIYRQSSKTLTLKSINLVRISSDVIYFTCPDGFSIELQATVR